MNDAWPEAHQGDGKREGTSYQAHCRSQGARGATLATHLKLNEAEALGQCRFEQLIEMRRNPADCAARGTEQQDGGNAVFARHAATGASTSAETRGT